MRQITAKSMGQAWFTVMRAIMSEGNPCLYTDNAGEEYPVKELLGLNVIVEEPHWPDAIIEQNMVLSEFEWMKDNFTRIGTVPALCNADSYATRLYNYMDTKNQIDWVVRRLTEEPRLRSATITTFEPLRMRSTSPVSASSTSRLKTAPGRCMPTAAPWIWAPRPTPTSLCSMTFWQTSPSV